METEKDSSYRRDATDSFSFRPFTSKGIILNLERFPGNVVIENSQFMQNMLYIRGMYYSLYPESTSLLSKTGTINSDDFY